MPGPVAAIRASQPALTGSRHHRRSQGDDLGTAGIAGDHLAKMSFPGLQRDTFLRQPVELVIDLTMNITVAMSQHGEPVITRNAKSRQSSCHRPPKIMWRRSMALKAGDNISIGAVVIEFVKQLDERFGQAVAR